MNLEKLKPTAITPIICSIGVLSIILTLIFLENRIFFLTTDIVKLLIIGVSVTIPVVIFNSILVLVFSKNPRVDVDRVDNLYISIASAGAILALLVFSVCLVLRLFINLSFTEIVIAVFILEILILILAILLHMKII